MTQGALGHSKLTSSAHLLHLRPPRGLATFATQKHVGIPFSDNLRMSPKLNFDHVGQKSSLLSK